MPAYNFQSRFAQDVRKGEKTQTIRAKRKVRPIMGHIAHCFTGQRTKHCEHLGDFVITDVYDVKLDTCGVLINGAALTPMALHALATNDGFKDWPEMLFWFEKTHGLPFSGDLIVWDPTVGRMPPRGWITDRLPDSDITVLIRCSGTENPIWMGFHDGEQWLSADTTPLEGPILGWLDLDDAALILDGSGRRGADAGWTD